jgi:hypothetical protein
VRDEFVDEILDLGDAGGGDAPGAAGGGGRGGAAGECALGGGETGDFFGRKQKDLAVVLDVAAVGGEGGAKVFFVHLAGGETEREGELAAGFGDVALDVDLGELGGVFLEVVGEVGVPGVAERVEMDGEKVERLVAVAEPPLAGERVEGKPVGFYEIESGGVGALFAGWEADGEEVLAAVDGERS